jgi:hypothetical protein
MRCAAPRSSVAATHFNGGPIGAITWNRIVAARRVQPSKGPNGIRGWALPWPGGQHRLRSSSRHRRPDLRVLQQRRRARPARIDDPGYSAVCPVSDEPDTHYVEPGWPRRTCWTCRFGRSSGAERRRGTGWIHWARWSNRPARTRRLNWHNRSARTSRANRPSRRDRTGRSRRLAHIFRCAEWPAV